MVKYKLQRRHKKLFIKFELYTHFKKDYICMLFSYVLYPTVTDDSVNPDDCVAGHES
jgi:hypothetical protein